MKKEEEVIAYIRENPGCSDREIADFVLGIDAHQAPVNIICRTLEGRGLIVRTERPIRNYMLSDYVKEFGVPPKAPKVPQERFSAQKGRETHIRKEVFLENLAKALGPIISSPIEFKEDISPNDLLTLKMATSPIDNLITYELTKKFLHRLFREGYLDEGRLASLLEEQEKTSSNENGFDIFDEDGKMIGEVKGTVPYGGKRYGAAQIRSIVKDFAGLANGKTKGKKINHDEYYKFMVLLDTKEARDAAIALLHSEEISSLRYPSVLVEDGDYGMEQINVVLVSLEE